MSSTPIQTKSRHSGVQRFTNLAGNLPARLPCCCIAFKPPRLGLGGLLLAEQGLPQVRQAAFFGNLIA